MESAGDPADGAFQQRYLKSPRACYGLKTKQRIEMYKVAFPDWRKLERARALGFFNELWAGRSWDERIAALWVLTSIERQLTPDDLPFLLGIARACEGWADTDNFSHEILGKMALRLGELIYPDIRAWSNDDVLWARRAAIIVHNIPARNARLAHKYAWPTWEERLHEKDFFIRKAIGWALREACKHYPEMACDFLARVGDRASALTRREGSRNLPDELKAKLTSTG